MEFNPVIAILIFSMILVNEAKVLNPSPDKCRKISSCSTCITESSCTWCVTKSKCTSQSCGNDNIIYPQDVPAIMAGPTFCPRVVEPQEPFTIQSGTKRAIEVKITQIHLYMAFTPWKCQISLEGTDEPSTVSAMLIGDTVFCEAVVFSNESNKPSISGSVSVQWDFTKTFDGSLPIKVINESIN